MSPLRLLLACGWFALCVGAQAHVTGTGLATLDWHGDRATLRLTLAPSDVGPSAATTIAAAAQGETDASRVVSEWLRQHVRVSVGDSPCRVVRTRLQAAAGGDRLVLQQELHCASAPGRIEVSDTLAAVFGEHYRTITSIARPDGSRVERVFDGEHPQAEVDWQAAPASFVDFVRLGAAHIAGGWDHLLFLAALLIGQRSVRSLLLAVTGFTVAHSLSLAAAALGWFHASAVWVEPAIAVSIVWVALENLRKQRVAWRRQALTVGFGFVHGLAFAEALTDLHLAGRSLARALLGFNLGVELAQAVGVIAVAPLLAWLARRSGGARIERALSLAIAAMGAIWLIQRLTGS